MSENNPEINRAAAVELEARRIFGEMVLGKKQTRLDGEVGERVKQMWERHLEEQKQARAGVNTLLSETDSTPHSSAQEKGVKEAYRVILLNLHMKTWVAILTGKQFSDRASINEGDIDTLLEQYPTREDFMGGKARDTVDKFLSLISVSSGSKAAADQKRGEYIHALGELADLLYGEVTQGVRRRKIHVNP